MCVCVFSCVQLFVTPWTVSCQAPLSMEFSRLECWSGLPFPTPVDLPCPATTSLVTYTLAAWLFFFFFFLFTTAPPGNSMEFIILDFKIALESVTNFLLLFLTLEYKCHNCYLCLSYHYILAEDNFLSYLTGSQMERNLALDWII